MSLLDTLTYGMEIECLVPLDKVSYEDEGNTINCDGKPWDIGEDGSIHCDDGTWGMEFRSPILRTSDGLNSIVEACNWLSTKGTYVNSSCGFHVHIGWPRYRTDDELRRLVWLVANLEDGLWATTGSVQRRLNPEYCHSVKERNWYRKWAHDKIFNDVCYDFSTRYSTLNLSNLIEDYRNTVEFRLFAGTVNPIKILGHVQCCLGLVEKAISIPKTAPWDLAKIDEKRRKKGYFLREYHRLMSQLGWNEGSAQRFGLFENGPVPILKIKTILRKLARKFDNVWFQHESYNASNSFKERK